MAEKLVRSSANLRLLSKDYEDKMKKINLIILSISILSFFTSTIYSQSKVGTTIGQFLKIEPSSRAVAIGNAGVALSGEASALFYNPASLGRIKGADVQFTINEWLADITYNYAVIAYNVDRIGTFALNATSLNSGDIAVRTVERPEGTGEKYRVTNFALGLGFGTLLTDRVSVGFQFTYLNESIWHSSLSNFSFNLGVQYQLYTDGLTIGASLSNFGPKAAFSGRDLYINYDFDPDKYGDNDQLPAELRTDEFGLPTTFRAGISYPIRIDDDKSITLAVDAIHPNDNQETINIGSEINLFNLLSLRAGYQNLLLTEAEGKLVFGGGVKTSFDNYTLRFDYAFADYGRLAQAHRITLGVQF